MQPEAKRVLLKQACLIFIGNLCVEQQLRAYIASDMGGLLSQVINMFENDVKTKPFDWVESTNKQLQVLVNCGLEQNAQTIMAKTTIVKSIELMLDSFDVLPVEPEKKEALSRIISLFSKLMKTAAGSLAIISSKEIISRLLLYFMTDETEYFKNTLITLHACCRHPGFRESCFDKLGFELKHFDPYVAKANKKFTEAFENQAWDDYVNICASISAFCTTFPERKGDFKDVIAPLIKVMGDKLDSVRKNSAVLLAKLVEEHEDNKKIMKANHGSEILMSVQQSLMK